jgi:hypothetical protein
LAAGAVRLVGLAGGGGGTADKLAESVAESARFVAMPLPVVLHIAGATLFCLLGAFQFDAVRRRRSPVLHRTAGRVAAVGGMLAALTGLWMTIGYPIPAALQGDLLYGVRVLVGVSMALCLVASVRAVLRRRIDQHRAWMVRAYALGQGAGTQVLLLLPVTLIVGAPTFFVRDVLMVSAWGLNVLFAEWIIRRRLSSV